MYLPSNQPILTQQRENAARHGAESDQRIAAMRRTAACGRARLFNTLVAPNAVADSIGSGTGLDTAKLQAQTEISRATGILGTGDQIDLNRGPSAAEIISGAPEVVSLNRGGGCGTYAPVPLGRDPVPGMPARAPNIVQGPNGVMNYRGADSTISGDYPTRTAVDGWPAGRPRAGLMGYAPPWSDAAVLNDGGLPAPGVGSWLMDHPLWALALAGAGLYALSRRKKAGR